MELTLVTVVAAHLLAVNLAGAGPLVLVWLDWFGCRRQWPQGQQAALRLGWWSIAAAAIGVALGAGAGGAFLFAAASVCRVSVGDSQSGAGGPLVVCGGRTGVLLRVHVRLRVGVATV